MNLVDEQHIIGLEIRQDRRQVARLRNHRPGRRPEPHAHLPRQDLRQRCLAEAGRPEQQHMVQRLLPPPRRLDIDFQIRLRLALADIILKRLRTERPVERVPALGVGVRESAVAAHRASSFSAPFTSAPTSSAPSFAAAATARDASDGV